VRLGGKEYLESGDGGGLGPGDGSAGDGGGWSKINFGCIRRQTGMFNTQVGRWARGGAQGGVSGLWREGGREKGVDRTSSSVKTCKPVNMKRLRNCEGYLFSRVDRGMYRQRAKGDTHTHTHTHTRTHAHSKRDGEG